MAKPKTVKVATNATNGEHPFGGDLTITINGEHSKNDNAREIHTAVQIFYRIGEVPFMEPLLLNRKANNGSGAIKYNDTATFTPKALGNHSIRVIAWNGKAAEKPANGDDCLRAGIVRVRVK